MLSTEIRDALTRGLVLAYPRAWRDRYGDEFAAVLEQRLTLSSAADVLWGALDAWMFEMRAVLRGPHGADARAIAVYVVLMVMVFAILRLLVGPGRLDVGVAWGIAYGVGYLVLCRVLKTRRARQRAAP